MISPNTGRKKDSEHDCSKSFYTCGCRTSSSDKLPEATPNATFLVRLPMEFPCNHSKRSRRSRQQPKRRANLRRQRLALAIQRSRDLEKLVNGDGLTMQQAADLAGVSTATVCYRVKIVQELPNELLSRLECSTGALAHPRISERTLRRLTQLPQPIRAKAIREILQQLNALQSPRQDAGLSDDMPPA